MDQQSLRNYVKRFYSIGDSENLLKLRSILKVHEANLTAFVNGEDSLEAGQLELLEAFATGRLASCATSGQYIIKPAPVTIPLGVRAPSTGVRNLRYPGGAEPSYNNAAWGQPSGARPMELIPPTNTLAHEGAAYGKPVPVDLDKTKKTLAEKLGVKKSPRVEPLWGTKKGTG